MKSQARCSLGIDRSAQMERERERDLDSGEETVRRVIYK